MKNTKLKVGFTLLAATTLLASCGGNGGNSSSEAKKSSSDTPTTSEASIQYDVVIKDAEGGTIKEEKIGVNGAIAKPADPTAPAGKVFYGWKNVNNGGQIWDFEEEHKLNQVMDNVELQPVFVPAGMNAQTFEAELVHEIQEANGGTGMDGATYSGGAKGKQLVGRDYDGEIGCTSVEKITYIDAYDTQDDADADVGAEHYETYDEIPAGKVKVNREKDIDYGAYVHFLYEKGDTLTWKLNSDKAATGVTLFARFSAEYGKPDEETFDNVDSFDDTMFPIKVNGTAMKYGSIAIHNIEGTSGAHFIYCQDYLISATVDLKAGENTIEMIVDNNVTLNGTIAASAPVIDSIKLYSDSTITWPQPKFTNLVKD